METRLFESLSLGEGQFMLEINDGLDFHEVLKGELGRLHTTNFELLSLIATLDDVHVGRTDSGRSFVHLAVALPQEP